MVNELQALKPLKASVYICQVSGEHSSSITKILAYRTTSPVTFSCLLVSNCLGSILKLQTSMSSEPLMFVSKKTPNNAVMPQSSTIVIVLVHRKHNKYNHALQHITALLGVFWRQPSKSHET